MKSLFIENNVAASYTPQIKQLKSKKLIKKPKISKERLKNSRHSTQNSEFLIYKNSNAKVNRASFSVSKRMRGSFSSLKEKKIKTRNSCMKDRSHQSSNSRDIHRSKFLKYNKTINTNTSSRKIKHRRAGTSFYGQTMNLGNSTSGFTKPNKPHKREKLKLSKEIMRRLKMRSSNSSQVPGFMDKISVERSRKEKFDPYITQDLVKIGKMTSKKLGKAKDFPLPISMTSKKLKKTIQSRLR